MYSVCGDSPKAPARDLATCAATAVAEKVPGLPGPIASGATRVTSVWVNSYFRFVESVLAAERRAAENLVGLNSAVISPRLRTPNEAPVQAA